MQSSGAGSFLDQVLAAAGHPWLAIGALCAALILLLALILLAGRHNRLRQQLVALGPGDKIATPPFEPHGTVLRSPVDRVLPSHPVVFYILVLAISVACWLGGLALAPSTQRFLESREWHIQPFYLAAHLIALRLFIRLFVRKYAAGASQLDIPAQTVADSIRLVLGPVGAGVALVIAVPFCVLDYFYLVSDRYEKLSPDHGLRAVDYLMWGIWCTEWLLNAFMWVTVAGFLALSYRALRTSRFRAPIATVVQEKLYRPFLQMSSQGASIVLGFACVTAVYIVYAGGALSDFIGLGVTGVLLVAGFVPSWLLLNAKVKRTVREEIEALRRNMPAPVSGERVLAGAGADPARPRSVEERLDEVVALMRAWHLERLQLDLGRTEARALAMRLAAPAATAGWQLYSNLQSILGKVGGILSGIGRLFL